MHNHISSHQRTSLCFLSLKRWWHLSRKNDLNHVMKCLLTAWFTQFYCFKQRLSIHIDYVKKSLQATENHSYLFTVYHSEINDQSKWVNQNIECKLRIYCNHMQNNWVKWISMMKFNDNFNIFSITSMTFFYFNKEFHSWMSFNSDMTDYETTHKWLEARKANDIVIWMKELLSFDHQQLKKTKLIIKVQINKHKRNVTYEVNNWVWLSFRNVKTMRLCKDLKDKQLDFY